MRTAVDACDRLQKRLWGPHGHRSLKESALEVDSGGKISCRTGDSNRINIAPGFSIGRSTNWAIAAPRYICMIVTALNTLPHFVCICLLYLTCSNKDYWLIHIIAQEHWLSLSFVCLFWPDLLYRREGVEGKGGRRYKRTEWQQLTETDNKFFDEFWTRCNKLNYFCVWRRLRAV